MRKIDRRLAIIIEIVLTAVVFLMLGMLLAGTAPSTPPETTPAQTEAETPATTQPVTTPTVTTPPETTAPETTAPETTPPTTEPPVTEPPTTEPPTTEPPVTEPPVTEPPVTEPPVTEPPVTEPPVTEPPATEPPVTEPPVTEPPQPPVTEPYQSLNYKDVKAMWISQYDLINVYTKSKAQRSESEYRAMMTVILDNAVKDGFNTVIVQVRPYADSMYPSEYYPMSRFVVGVYGRDASYDPFAIIVSMAHERGLSVHAWINPMRGMLTSEVKSVSDKYMIKKWYSDSQKSGKWVVTVSDRLYLNPAYAEVRRLIVSGAKEILQRYNVDGLHMDDYFYPTTSTSFDKAAYDEYVSGGGKLSLADFRREQLNLLVSELYSAVKEENESLIFGISPAGNINNVYNKQYADVYTWCSQEGYIDYICPQVYFGLEHQTYDFVSVCKTWQDIIKTDSVDLIVGMTLGKADSKEDAYAGSGKDEWKNSTDILLRCLNHTETLDKCIGVSYFSYQYFYNPTSGTPDADTAAERANFIPRLKEISWS